MAAVFTHKIPLTYKLTEIIMKMQAVASESSRS